MDKNQIQKSIIGLFLVILLLISCQSRNDCGFKCGIDMSQKKEKVCIILDTSVIRKPYIRYYHLPQEKKFMKDVRTFALHLKSEMWQDDYELWIGYTMNSDSAHVDHIMNEEMEYYEKYKDSVFLLYEDEISVDYKLFDTLNNGYISYDYDTYIGAKASWYGRVEVNYTRKEAEDRILYVVMRLYDSSFRTGDSLFFVQLIESLEVLNEGCVKKCLCYPD